MKKLLIVLLVGIVPMVSFGRHHHGGFRPGPPPMHHHGGFHRHHHGPGYFWGGVAVGTLVGTALTAPYRTPVYVAPPPPPPFLATRVWVPARVETRYDSWGRPYIVTIPGHWE